MFKIGVFVITSRVMLKAKKRLDKMKNEEKEKKERAAKLKEKSKGNTTLLYYFKWEFDG